MPGDSQVLPFRICPACHSTRAQAFYSVATVPAHSVLLMNSEAEAIGYPTGDIDLCHCSQCDFIFNGQFDQKLNDYSASYEETQHFSATFSRFASDLCRRLVSEFGVQHKQVVEIGCGKGEFLAELCTLGQNRGIGIDPACAPDRLSPTAREKIEFRPALFDAQIRRLEADVVCCRHTLEHIPDVSAFLKRLRAAIDPERTRLVFFEVPAAEIILREQRFWDIYYEHCSYFTASSLRKLFVECGFTVDAIENAFADQYLLLFARPTPSDSSDISSPENRDLGDEIPSSDLIEIFQQGIQSKLAKWRFELANSPRDRIALWGAGSKCVSLLTTLGLQPNDLTVVDINPFKQGKYLPGTGNLVQPPGALASLKPDKVIIMNPVYQAEIENWLESNQLQPQLICLN